MAALERFLKVREWLPRSRTGANGRVSIPSRPSGVRERHRPLDKSPCLLVPRRGGSIPAGSGRRAAIALRDPTDSGPGGRLHVIEQPGVRINRQHAGRGSESHCSRRTDGGGDQERVSLLRAGPTMDGKGFAELTATRARSTSHSAQRPGYGRGLMAGAPLVPDADYGLAPKGDLVCGTVFRLRSPGCIGEAIGSGRSPAGAGGATSSAHQ
jgi:hypothetical protein